VGMQSEQHEWEVTCSPNITGRVGWQLLTKKTKQGKSGEERSSLREKAVNDILRKEDYSGKRKDVEEAKIGSCRG